MNLSRNFTLLELIKSDTAVRKGINNNPNAGQIEKLKDHPQIEFLQMFEEHEDGTYLRAPWKTPWGFPKIDPIKS